MIARLWPLATVAALALAGQAAFTAAQPAKAATPLAAAPADAADETSSTGPVTVLATADKAEVTVGEVFIIELKAMGPEGTTYTFPAEASTDSFELRSAALAQGALGGRPADAAVGSAGAGTPAVDAAPPAEPGVHRYQAVVFALGEVEMPAIPVRYRLPDGTEDLATSAPLTLKVVTLLSKDPAEQKLVDVRSPVGASIGRAFWIALGVLLLAVAAVVYGLLRRRRREAVAAVAPPVPDLPPDIEARRGLDALEARQLPERGEFRPFYIELAHIAKRYLERRLEAPVVEMTSAETLAFLRGHAHGGELLPVVRDLAEAADRIKFAKGDGLADEARRHLASVRRLLGALEERLRPAAAAGEGKVA